MICVKCTRASTNVANSRPHKKQASVWRRRRCVHCGYVFTTAETPLISELLEVIYANGDSAAFSTPRLTVSLAGFLAHRRETAADDAYWLSKTIGQTFLQRGNSGQAIPMHEFIKTVHSVLERFDALAGLQYAARYRIVTNIRKDTGRPRLKK
jgi:transcriptional repressor NrdR